jgi:hypothetical protein
MEKERKKERKALLELLSMELNYCYPSLALKLMLLHFCVQDLCFQPLFLVSCQQPLPLLLSVISAKEAETDHTG